jgi:cell division protein FtsW (lipid II flippase)
MLAFLPVALGASAMASLGVANEGARLPVLWMLAGAAGAAAPAWVFINNDAGTATLFGATGAICALAARWRTRWPEPSAS